MLKLTLRLDLFSKKFISKKMGISHELKYFPSPKQRKNAVKNLTFFIIATVLKTHI